MAAKVSKNISGVISIKWVYCQGICLAVLLILFILTNIEAASANNNIVNVSESILHIQDQNTNSASYITYITYGPQLTQLTHNKIFLSGKGVLNNGLASIVFDPSFSSVISSSSKIKVIVTATSPMLGNLYTAEKSIHGFVVKELNVQESGITFDWLVIAQLPKEASAVSQTHNNFSFLTQHDHAEAPTTSTNLLAAQISTATTNNSSTTVFQNATISTQLIANPLDTTTSSSGQAATSTLTTTP